MRRQRYLRASSAQSLCIFCACRLAGDLPPALSTLPRRSLHTGRRDRQQAEAVAPPPTAQTDQPPRQQSSSFDPNSTLSRSEQEERHRFRQAREQRQREEEERVRAAQAAQRALQERQRAQQVWQDSRARGAQEKEDREAQERVCAQWKQSEGRKQQSISAGLVRHIGGRQGRVMGHRRLDLSAGGQQTDRASIAPETKAGRATRVDDGVRPDGRPPRQDRRASGRGDRKGGQVQSATRFEQRGARRSNPDMNSSQRSQVKQDKPARLDDPFASTAASPVEREAPSFGSFSTSQPDKPRNVEDGWGSGAVKRAPIQYSETRPADFNDDNAASTPFTPASGQRADTAKEVSTWPKHETGINPNISTVQDAATSHEQLTSPFDGPYVPQKPSQRQGILDDSREQNGSSQGSQQDRTVSRGAAFPEQPKSESGEQASRLSGQPGYQSRPNKVPDFVATLQQAERRKTQRHGGDKWAEDRQRGPRLASGWTDTKSEPEHDNISSTQTEPSEESKSHSTEIYRAPPQPRASPNPRPSSSHTDTGYRATMLDAADFQPAEPSFDEAQAAQWQHLKRRDSVPVQPAPASVSRQHQQHQQQQQLPPDGDWIDRSFRQHQQERGRRLPAYLDNQQTREAAQNGQSPFEARDAARMAQTKCGRCQQLGHVARDCTTPERRVCYKCGQAGHLAGQCPNSAQRDGGSSQGGRRTDNFAKGGSRAYEPAVRRLETMDQPKQDRNPFAPEAAQQDSGGRNDQRREPREHDVRQDLIGRRRPVPADVEEEPEERVLRSRKFAEKEEPAKKRSGRRRAEDEEDDDAGGAARDERNARKAARKAQKAQEKMEKAEERKARRTEQGPPVHLPEFVSVATLAQQLGVRYESFVSRVERLGYDDVFPGKILNAETSGMIAMEYGFEPFFGGGEAEEVERDLRARPAPEEEERAFLPTRPPVVTIMGHVDHGKTTLLDFLRKTRVVDAEAGGITQHIGAFSVEVAEKGGKTVTFLDTPGHAAFLAMRQRGANVTDIVILVVAADDGVKPQTIEAIRCAKTAGVPILVAVNKIDKEGADVERVKGDLARHGVVVEEFGGDVVAVPVSGKTGEGVGDLVEAVVVSAEILDKRAEVEGLVEGWVLEGTTRKAGRVATVLVKRGTLRPGAVVVAGKTWARVRTLRDQAGKMVPEVGPGMPVEVDGWRDQPVAGDEVLQAETEQKATDVVEFRREREERVKTAADTEAINEARRLEQERVRKEKAAEAAKRAGTEIDYFEAAARDEPAAQGGAETTTPGHMTVPFIIKADVSGSAEAVAEYILSLSSPLITPQILQSAVGPINQSDVDLASAAQGHIIAFNLPSDEGMKGVAERVGVKVLENNVIYRVLDDVKAVLEEKLPPIVSTRVLGEAEIGVGFEIGVGGRKKVRIAGCKVRNGIIGRGARVKVLRGGVRVYDGVISSLKNVKKDVQEMRKGTECGMGFDDWEAFEVGDQVQTYEEISEKRRL